MEKTTKLNEVIQKINELYRITISLSDKERELDCNTMSPGDIGNINNEKSYLEEVLNNLSRTLPNDRGIIHNFSSKELNAFVRGLTREGRYLDGGIVYFLKGEETKALKYFKWVLRNDPQANVHMALGDIYHYGLGVLKDEDLASAYYGEAIENGEYDDSIARRIGKFYLLCGNYYKNGDIKEAIEFYKKAFTYGSIEACIKLAEIYLLTREDEQLAVETFKLAASQGKDDRDHCPDFDRENTIYANNSLGMLAEELPEEAIEYYENAAALGSIEALRLLSKIYKNKGNLERANELYAYTIDDNESSSRYGSRTA